MPERVQVEGDLFHGRVPAGAVYVGRQAPGLRRSKWHNPFKPGATTPLTWTRPFGGITPRDVGHAVELFRDLAMSSPGYLAEARAALAGRDLACWCKPGQPCHGTVLVEIANPDQFPPPAASPLDHAMFTAWLHCDWRFVSSKMTTEEREAPVEAILRYDRELKAGEPDEDALTRESVAWWD